MFDDCPFELDDDADDKEEEEEEELVTVWTGNAMAYECGNAPDDDVPLDDWCSAIELNSASQSNGPLESGIQNHRYVGNGCAWPAHGNSIDSNWPLSANISAGPLIEPDPYRWTIRGGKTSFSLPKMYTNKNKVKE